MAKRLRPRLSHKTKASVKVRTSIKLLVGFAGLAIVVALGWIVYLNFGPQKQGFSSQDNTLKEYQYRRSLQIPTSFVKEAKGLFGFPLWIELQDSDFKTIKYGGKLFSSKGWDICVTKNDGFTKLPIQIDYLDEQNGKLGLWLLADSLQISKPLDVFIYYSKGDVYTDPFKLCWPSDYGFVSHFQNDVHSKSRSMAKGTYSALKYDDGKTGLALNLNPESFVKYELSNDWNLNQDFTLGFWVNPQLSRSQQVILSNFESLSGFETGINKFNRIYWKMGLSNGKVFEYNESKVSQELQTNQWYFITLTYENSNRVFKTYINGNPEHQTRLDAAPAVQTAGIRIGSSEQTSNGLHGKLDELHLLSKTFTQSMIASFYTQVALMSDAAKLGIVEEINVSNEARAATKQAQFKLQQSDSARMANQQKAGEQFVRGNENLMPLTSNAQEIEAKLKKLQKVANDNTK